MNTKTSVAKLVMSVSLCASLLFAGTAGALPIAVHAAASTATAGSVIATGKHYMGVPYKYGAKAGQTNNFDCSSFIQYIFKKHGVDLPRSSRQQAKVGTYVAKRNLKPGDLVFFYSPIHHVALYIGNGKILHTYGKPGVTISNLNSKWWTRHYTTARRVLSITNATFSASSAATGTAKVVRKVNFRTGPSLRDRVIRKLNPGERVTILRSSGKYWYKIKDKHGKTGYVSSLSRYISA